MAGLRRLDGDFGGFEIADFAHQDHVRVLAQKGAQGGGKRQAGLVVHVDLVDAGQVYFHWVFRGRDVAVGCVQNMHRGIKADGFTATGGAGHQNHAIGPLDRL